MKNFTYYLTSLCFLLLLFFFSCEKEVTLEPTKTEQRLNVLCNFSPNEPFSIQLSKSQSIFTDDTDSSTSIGEATVEICKGNDLIEKVPQTSNDTDSGAKYLSMVAVPKTKEFYTLKISVDGLKPVTATSWVPEPVDIEHLSIGAINEYDDGQIDNVKEYDVRLALQFVDPSSEKNYYQVNFYQELVNNITLQDTTVLVSPNTNFTQIDESIAQNFNVLDGGLLFHDLVFDGELKELVFQPLFQYDNSTYEPKNIIVELRSVSEDYYKYYTSVYRQLRQTNPGGGGTLNGNVPFTDPVILYSNVENGYGVFAGYSKNVLKSPIEF